MNLGSHIAVAEILAPGDPEFWLGAALPDLGAIGGFRLLGDTAHASLAAGIKLHHQTDEAFHRSSWFLDHQRVLTNRLTEAGLPRGATKAVAHVGPELLLDGALGSRSDLHSRVAESFATITPNIHELKTLVVKDHGQWLEHLIEVQRRGSPQDYHDPAAVAARLHRILQRRKRLAFDAKHIDLVAAELALRWPCIADTGVAFVTEIAKTLRPAG